MQKKHFEGSEKILVDKSTAENKRMLKGRKYILQKLRRDIVERKGIAKG